MRRTIFTLLSVFTFIYLSAEEPKYNLFDAQDVDADGWLWFDTQAKIDKYIGQANNEIGAYTIGDNVKIIQLASTEYTVEKPDPNGFPGDVIQESLATIAFADTLGVSKEAVVVVDENEKETKEYQIGGPGSLKGAIVLPSGKASALGGGILIKLPPIVSYELYLSCESRMITNVKLSVKEDERFGNYQQVKGYMAPFSYLSKTAGHFTWKVGEEKNANTETAVKADVTQYVLAQNKTTRPMYVHGIRVFTVTPTTSVNNVNENIFNLYFNGKELVSNSQNADVTLYDLTGKVILAGRGTHTATDNIKDGVYIAKVVEGDKTQTTKIVIQ